MPRPPASSSGSPDDLPSLLFETRNMTHPCRRSRRLRFVSSLLAGPGGPAWVFGAVLFAAVSTFAGSASPQPPPPPSHPPSPASLLINAEIMVLHAANQP